MNKTYVIKVNSATATVQNVQVTSGQTQPTTVKVDGNVNVELVATATGKAPHKISVRRVGKDLHVAFEGGDPAHSDLILQDFYGENDNHLVGLAENGQYFEYIPTSGEGGFYVPLLSDGADAIQALGGAELAGAAWAPMYASAFPIGAVLGAIGAIGLAGVAIAAGGGSHKVEPLTTPTQRPNSYLDNVGPVQNLNSTATLTDDTTPGLHIGALPAGATGAVLYVDGVIKPATYDPATGTLTPNSPLPDGVHTLGYGLTNSVGTTTSSPTLTLTIDSTAPPAPVLHVTDTDGDGKPNLTGTGEPGGLVTITDPAGGKYTTMVDPTGKFELEIDMPSKPLGEWIATVTDPADNVSLPGKTIVTDLTAPTAPVAGVYDNVGSIQGLVPNKGVTDDATPNVSGTAEPGSVVTVMNDGKPVGTALADGSGVWSFTLPPLVDGTYTVTTKATDSQGNTGPTSAPVVFTVDTLAPPATTASTLTDDVGRIQGPIVNGTITDDANPTFTGKAEAGATITVRDGGIVQGTALVDASGNWTYPSTTLAPGAHSFTATVTDPAGNVSPATTPINFTVDLTVPTIAVNQVNDDVGAILGALKAGDVTDDNKPTVSGTGTPGGVVKLYLDGTTTVIGTAVVDSTGQWAITPIAPLTDGKHDLTVTVTTVATGENPPSAPFALTVDTTPPGAPAIVSVDDNVGRIQGHVTSGVPSDDTTPLLTGKAEAGSVVKIFDGGQLIGSAIADGSGTGVTTDDARPAFTGTAEANTTVVIRDGTVELGTALVNASGVWTFTPPSLLFNGLHHVTASELDAAGNVGPASVPFDFRLISGGIPTAPSITNVIDDVGTISNVQPFGLTDDRTPTVEGTAVPGSIVSLFSEDGTPLGTTTADAKGQWSITTPSLADGPHSLTATATDTTGIHSAPTGPYQIIVDATSPDMATNPVLTDNVGTVVGPILNNGVTDDATPTFTGSAEAGATVSVKDNGLELGTALVDAAGNWTFTSPHLDPGLHAFTATVMDTAGNVSAPTTPINFTLETSGVAIAIDQVLDDFGPIIGVLAMNASTDDRNPTVSGTATIGGMVKLYLDGTTTVIGTATADSAGHWVITPVTSLANGLHNLTATVTTATAVESPATPAITNVLDDVGGISNVPRHGFTNDPTPTVEGTAKPGETVRLYNEDGVQVGTIVADINGQWLITSPTLLEGAHSFTATSTDLAGNVSAPTAPYQIVVDFTVAAATVPVLTDNVGPTTGQILDHGVTDDATPTFTGKAEAGTTVTVMDGIASLGTTLVNAAGDWSFTPNTPLDPGAHAFTAIVTDAAGNVSAPTAPIHFTVDLAAQIVEINMVTDDVIAITGPLAQNDMTNDARPTVSGKATAGGVVKLYDETGALLGATVADNAGHWTITPAFDLPEGKHDLTATVTTATAPESAATAAFTLTVDTTRPIAPVIVSVTDDVGTIRGLEVPGAPSDDTTPTLTGTAEPLSTVTILDGTVQIGTAATDAKGNWTFTPISPLNEGVHAITTTATDAAGNVSPPSAPWSLLIDTLSPTIVPGITAVYDDQGATQGNVPNNPAWVIVSSTDDVGLHKGLIANGGPSDDSTPTLRGTAEPLSTVVLYDGAVKIGTTTTDAAGNWVFTPASPFNDGTHPITATATDAAGNVSLPSATWNELVDTTLPVTPVIVTVNDNAGIYTGDLTTGTPSDDNTPTLTGTAEALSTVTIKDNGTPIATVLANAAGIWTFTPTTATKLLDGTHPLTVTSTDAAGNESQPASFLSVIDTSPPPTPFIDFSNDNVALYTGDLPSNTPTNDTTPRMSGRAEPLSKVELFDNLTIVGSAMADAAGNWTITPTLTAQGAHPMTVTATDAAGNISVHSAIWVELIDTVKPNPPVIVSSGDDVNFYLGNIPSGVPTNDATPLIKGTSEANALINLFDNGVLTGTTLANALGDWSYTPTLGSEGSHAMTATATDAAGNTSPPSVIWTVNLDTIAPLASSFGIGASNDNLGIYQGNIAPGVSTNDDTPLMSGTAEVGSLINLYDAGVLMGTATADALGNWNITPTLNSTLAGQGVHAITITTTDVAGNVSVSSPAWNVQLDTIAPAFSSNPATAVNERTGAGTVIYTAAATDVSGITYAIVPGVDSGLFSINSTTGQVTMNFTPDYEAPGDVGGNNVYDYVVKATDSAGNVTTQNASLSVLDILDDQPHLTGVYAASGTGNVATGFVIGQYVANVPVTWSISGPDGGRFSIDSSGFIRTTSSYNSSSPSSTYHFDVTGTDVFGQFATAHPTFSYTPIALDLNGDRAIDYSHALVDLLGDGNKSDTAWVGKEDGLLLWDKYHDGQVHDSSQYAFAQYVSGAKTDLEGLKAFDTNGNGKLDSGDALWKEMNVWQDLNANGVSDAGEVKTLAAWGITSIGLTSDGVVSNPAAGVQEFGKTSATLENGTQMVVADAAFTATYHPGDHGDAVAQPFFIDMNHDGQITYDKALIDVSGTGYKELIAWAGKGDGVLVWDKYQDGLVHDSSQYSFGSLKIFDTNGDSKLDSHDVLWSQLSVWQDANGDGVSEAGEVKTMAQLGIQSIGLASDGAVTTPAEGVKELGKSAAVMEDGSAMTIAQAAVSHVTTDTLHPLSYLDQTYAVI